MASNHTENFALSQWEASDAFVRVDFNDDNAKIDAALQRLTTEKAEKTEISALGDAKADQAEFETLEKSVSDLTADVGLRCYMKAGIYSGDGKSSQVIDVGFEVKAVLVENQSGARNSSSNDGSRGGLAVKGHGLIHGTTLISVSGTGFKVYNGSEYQGSFNREGGIYYYVALG